MSVICVTPANLAPPRPDRLVSVETSSHADAALLQHAQRLSVAVDQSPAAVFITDTTGRIEYVNQRFSEITGYAAESEPPTSSVRRHSVEGLREPLEHDPRGARVAARGAEQAQERGALLERGLHFPNAGRR